MRPQITALAVLLFGCVAAQASDVLELTDSNFKSTINSNELILVEFFAPWCGHCKRLAPEYEVAATALKKTDPPVPIAKVDCTEAGKTVCSENGVSGYPTLKIFKNGEVLKDYDGERNSAGIIGTMKKMSGPSSVTLKDAAHLDKKLEDAEDILVVGFFAEENDMMATFLKVADKRSEEFNFAHTTDPEILKHYGYENVIVLFRPKHLKAKFDDLKEVFDREEFIAANLEDFIELNLHGMVGHMRPHNEKYFKKPLITAYYLVDYKRNKKGTNYFRNRVGRVAKKFVDKAYFSIAAKSDYSRKIEDFQQDTASEDVVVAAVNADGDKFMMPGDFSVEALEKFVNDLLEGKLVAYLKSEDIPESNDDPVKVVVGRTFKEIVNDPTKDVLIEFYAPWCGHCKSLEPKYTELAEKLKDVKDVVIAKMDATANDVPSTFTVTGFPTIYWSPMGSKDAPKRYESGREVDDFLAFIKKEATNPFDLTDKKKKKKAKKEL